MPRSYFIFSRISSSAGIIDGIQQDIGANERQAREVAACEG
jgi:hypothetical protein